MALVPINAQHALQILAGTQGRNTGHSYEEDLANAINQLPVPLNINTLPTSGNVFQTSNEALTLILYIAQKLNIQKITHLFSVATGGLATSSKSQGVMFNGQNIKKCKSDILIKINHIHDIGVSVKQCNNKNPTNAQVYFSTATGFSNLLRNNQINVSQVAETALKQFCGDAGFNPIDNNATQGRVVDHRRYFWEEINTAGRQEWENTFSTYQDEISRILLQKAYSNDPFAPTFILHKTKLTTTIPEVAIYTIDELIQKSRSYNLFSTEPYRINKGSFRDPDGVVHLAPRFGIFQMQRAGNKQHPTQLQFNLKSGYFYVI